MKEFFEVISKKKEIVERIGIEKIIVIELKKKIKGEIIYLMNFIIGKKIKRKMEII